MKFLVTLLLAALSLNAVGQVEYPFPYNPDVNSDGYIGINDLMELLSIYGEEFGSDHANFNDQFELFDEFSIYNHGVDDINKYSKIEKIKEETLCIICSIDFNKDKEFRVMDCGHKYCVSCADKWFEICVRCPLCNNEFETNKRDPYMYTDNYDDDDEGFDYVHNNIPELG